MAQGWTVNATADTITFYEPPAVGTNNVLVKELADAGQGGTRGGEGEGPAGDDGPPVVGAPHGGEGGEGEQEGSCGLVGGHDSTTSRGCQSAWWANETTCTSMRRSSRSRSAYHSR